MHAIQLGLSNCSAGRGGSEWDVPAHFRCEFRVIARVSRVIEGLSTLVICRRARSN